MNQELLIYLDGQIVPQSQAKVSVFDHGLLYGDGVFEGIRFYNGRVFRLEEHTRRIFDSAKSILLTIPLTPYQITRSLIYYPGLYSAVPPLPSSPQLLIMSPIRLTIISVD